MALRAWANAAAGSEILQRGPVSLPLPRRFEFQAWYAYSTFVGLRYVLVAAVLVAAASSILSRKHSWVYALIAAALAAPAWFFGYRVYCLHLRPIPDPWDVCLELLALVAPPATAAGLGWVAAAWKSTRKSNESLS